MYDLDFDTCTMRDVVQRSITCHPSLFRAGMIRAAEIHSDYAQSSRDIIAAGIARKAASACLTVYDAIDRDDAAEIAGDLSLLIQAFTVAAKLQVLPYATSQAIAARWQA